MPVRIPVRWWQGPVMVGAGLLSTMCSGFAIPASAQRVEVAGAASVLMPAGSWRSERKEVVLGESVRLNKEHPAFTRAEDVHTILAILETHSALGVPDHEAYFRHFGFRQEHFTLGGRLTNITYAAIRETSGPDCLRYTSRNADRGVPQYPGHVFLTYDRGRLCFHPTRPIVVWAAWSERFSAEQEAAATGSEEVERFLGSVLFVGGPQPTDEPLDPVTPGVVLFSDRFDSARRIWATGENEYARTAYTSRGYQAEFKGDDGGHVRTLALGDPANSVRVELTVDVTPSPSPRRQAWYGIVCTTQLQAETAYYHMIVSYDGEYKIAKLVAKPLDPMPLTFGGKITVLADSHQGWAPEVAQAGLRRLRADCVTSGKTTSLVLRVNGATLLSARDTDPASAGRGGRPGIYAEGDARTKFTFRSFEVRELR